MARYCEAIVLAEQAASPLNATAYRSRSSALPFHGRDQQGIGTRHHIFSCQGESLGAFGAPESNITGLSMLLTELAVKELEILKEAVPQAFRLGIIWNPTTPSQVPALTAVESAGKTLGN
jgi:hypothetical protein